MTELERAGAFLRDLELRLAERVEPFPWGRAVVNTRFPRVYDVNFLLVEEGGADVTAEALAAEARRIQGGARLAHRQIEVPELALAERLVPGFAALGWSAHPYVVMSLHRSPDRAPDSHEVIETDEATLRPARERFVRSQPYGTDDEAVRQLVDVHALRPMRRFAAVAGGEIASYCELYSDGSTAQVEDVVTLDEHRGRGLARAVIGAALEAARGHDLIFLVADASDWLRQLYRKLGFDEIGLRFEFARRPTAEARSERIAI